MPELRRGGSQDAVPPNASPHSSFTWGRMMNDFFHSQPIGAMPWPARMLAMIHVDIMLVCAAIADIAVKTEAATSDEMLILWCLIGGSCGSVCSLRFFQPKTPFESTSQIFVNIVLSTMLSPIIVDQLSKATGFPVGLRLALPVSLIAGIMACQTVARMIPWAQKWVDAKGQKIVDDVGK